MPEYDSSAPQREAALATQGGWVLGGTLAAGLASTGVMLLLAGILTPREFGIVAVAIVIFEGACVGLSPGLAQALHSIKGSDDHDRAALGMALLAGATVAVLGLPLAPVLTGLLGVPEATTLSWAALLAVMPRRWNEVRVAQYERDLNFSKPNTLVAISAIAGGVTAVVAAIAGAGPWALLLQLVATELFTAIALSAFGPQPVIPGWDGAAVRDLLHFSRKLIGNSIAVYGYTNLDDVVVARVAGPASLGAYNLAYRIANLIALAIARPAQRVLLPTLRAFQFSGDGWQAPFVRTLGAVSWVSGIACAGVAFLGPGALELAYDGRWEESYLPLQIFAFYAAFRAIGALTGTVFLASGRPALVMRIASWQLVALALLIIPATLAYGHVGAAIAVTLPLAGGVTYALITASRIIRVSPIIAIRLVVLRWLAAAGVGIASSLIHAYVGGWVGLAAAGVAIIGTAVPATLIGPFGLRRPPRVPG